MISKIVNIFKVPELRKKIGFTLALLFVFRLGGIVLVPNIDRDAIDAFVKLSETNLFGLYNLFAGGFFSQFSIFALGIMPYISASIIIQLLGAVVPYFQRLQKEGPEGRKKITQLTRFTTCVILVTGTVFVMWLGEQITNHGIGNGISLIIMVGILASLPKVVVTQTQNLINGEINPFSFIIALVLLIGIIVFVVLISTGIRKIPVSYAKRIVGRKMYGGQSQHLPLRILTAGVMPIIFAQALVLIPSSIGTFFTGTGFGNFVQTYFGDFQAWPYNIFLAIMIIGFTYFYTAVAFNPVDVADNMKKQGGFIPGVRPGKSTADFIDNILQKITLPAAFFLGFIAILPNIISRYTGMDIGTATFFGGTSILILVGVALDTLQQIESQLLMRNYDGFLKTGKIKGRKRY